MSDIDFDELDKAVSKYVGSVSSSGAQQSANDTPSDQLPSNSPQPVAPDAVVSSSNVLPKRRSSGRFMDVVHPSSDMATTKSTSEGDPKDNLSPSVERKSLQPVSEDFQVESEKKEVEVVPSNDEPVVKQDDTSSAHEWPDPLDLHSSSDDKEESKDEAVEPPTPTAGNPFFLADAKVEKRPLGGLKKDAPADEAPTSLPLTEDTKKEGGDTEKELDLPPELEKDLVAIEAGEAPEIEEKEIAEADTSKEDETPLPEPIKTDSVEKKDEKAPVVTSGLLATGSIPQQYKPAPSAPEPADTDPPVLLHADHYEKTPAQTVPKHKSKAAAVFQWIFIILGLLLLGGTLGAAFFVFVSR